MKRARTRSRRRRVAAFLVAAVAVLVLLDPSALRLGDTAAPDELVSTASAAHVTLRRSEPSAGDSLAAAPRLLRLEFTDVVEIELARLSLVGPAPDTVPVPLSPLRRETGADAGGAATAGERRTIVADVNGALSPGSYTVRWTIAGRDGHPVNGRFSFAIAPDPRVTVGGSEARGAPVREAPSATTDSRTAADPSTGPSGARLRTPPDDANAFDAQSGAFVAVRWLTVAGLLGVIGGLVFRVAVLARVMRRAPSESAALVTAAVPRVRLAGVLAAFALLAAVALRLMAQIRAVFGEGGADLTLVQPLLTGTAWGWAWLLQAAAAVIAFGALVLARQRPVAAPDAVWGASVIALALSAALSGHAAAANPPALAVALDATHVVAAGGWLGTLLFLGVAGIPAALSLAPGARARATRDLVLAFSGVALSCAAVVVLTGVASAWIEMRSFGALWQTQYGRTLLLKLAAVGLVAAVGAYNWRVVTPRLLEDGGPARIRRSAAVELLFGAVVLVVTAVLVATPPPADAAASEAAEVVVTP